MTKTTNYQLPQWEASDPIKRGDFNDAFAALDAGVVKAQGTADTARNEAGAAQNTAQAAYSAAQSAQSAADAAQATADLARTEAAARPFVIGSYTGLILDQAQDVEVGFRPSLLIIVGGAMPSTSECNYSLMAFITGDNEGGDITFTDTGFHVAKSDNNPRLDSSGIVYRYIAFR